MYPPGAVTYVTVTDMSERLCGRSRPGHFRGVTTAVSKLFHIIEPDAAFFGQKDAAQLALIRRMVQDLNMPVEIVGCPIVREPDGLAMSSRNAYLRPDERKAALVLHQALTRIEGEFQRGERMSSRLIDLGRQIFCAEPLAHLDYLEIVDPSTLEAVDDLSQPALTAVAAHIGSTRLIDNTVLGR
jgi:pantoate--beta-alanine ligase